MTSITKAFAYSRRFISEPMPRANFPESQCHLSVFSAAVFALLCGLSAFAQETQFSEAGSPVISNTVERAAPRAHPLFNNSRLSAPTPEFQNSEPPQPQGIHDDFDNDSPTAWWVYYGQSVADIDSTLKTDNARIIDIQVDAFSPYSFTVTYVQNTGAYAKSWWWYYGLTAAQVNADLTANKARPISVKAYDIGGGQIRFAVVMIANSGVDLKTWWWYYGQTPSDLTSLLSKNDARLIAFDPYVSGSSTVYTAIMIGDTGADKQAWWWYYNSSPAAINTAVNNNQARIFYMTPGATGTFNVIMEGCAAGCSDWYYYYGQTATQIVDTAVQDGARLVNLATYPGCGSVCFTGAMINNSNAITTRVSNIIRAGGISGTEGLYLKQVNGSVLANLEDGVVFEPASTLKVLANLYTMTKVQSGAVTLNTPITHYTNGADSCPNPPIVSGTEPLEIAVREMMYHSDNARTREVTDHWTEAKIDAYATSIGLPNTGFHEIVGCGPNTPGTDTLTLDDAGAIYEGVATQKLLNAKNRGIFYSNMAGRAQYDSEGYDWTGLWSTDIPNIINQVAPAGYTANQKTAYMNAMDLAYKAGNYVICANNNCTDVIEDISIAGWFQMPVCSATGTTYAEYVFGIMFSNEPSTGWSNGVTTQTDANFANAKGELLREQIQAGMQSCLGKSLDVLTWSPAGLTFNATAIGSTSTAQTITLTNKQKTKAADLSISIFGAFTEINDCGTSLAAGKSCKVVVRFKPTTLGENIGAVIVTDNGTGQPQTIQATGETPVLDPP